MSTDNQKPSNDLTTALEADLPKPINADAMLFDGSQECADAIVAWVNAWRKMTLTAREYGRGTVILVVETPDGAARVPANGWVVRGLDRKFYVYGE